MRKLMCLVLVISGLAVGCGDSSGGSDDKKDAGGGDDNNNGIDIPDAGSPGGEEEVPFPECPREDIPAMFDAYTGPKTMTQAGYMACSTKCGMDNSCYTEANCPGVDAFNDCLNTEVIGCTAKAKGSCREEYENFVCCADGNKCGQDDTACIQGKCGGEIMKIQDCLPMDMACLQAAGGTCFAPAAPATAVSLGSSARTAISAASIARALQSMSASH